jgi:UDP-glucuronate 4-epimerase
MSRHSTSTSSVYGQQAVGNQRIPTRPASPYGVFILAAEYLLLAHVHDFPAVILRYFSIYGPRHRLNRAYHIFTRQLHAGATLMVFGDGRPSRSNTYVDACVRATLLGLEHDGARVAYSIGAGVEIAWTDTIEVLADAGGVRLYSSPFQHGPGTSGETGPTPERPSISLGIGPPRRPTWGCSVRWNGTCSREGDALGNSRPPLQRSDLRQWFQVDLDCALFSARGPTP